MVASSASNEEEMDEKYVIQLSSTNYQRWKYEVQAILESKEVMDIVDGTEARPTDPNKLKAWRKGDATARMVLSRSLDEEHHSFIRACKTSAEIWTTLVTIKERTNSSTKLIASQDFAALRFDPGTTVGSFLAAFNAIVGKMESSGIKVEDSTKIGKVLHCLPTEYDSFRQSWRLTKDDKATFTDLQSQLLATEADIKSRDPLAASGGEAFLGKNVNGSANRNHKSKTDGGAADKKKRDRKKTIECFYCHKKGHIKKDCQQREHDERTGSSQEEDSSDGSMVSGQAYVATSSDQWLGDSGASSHITSHREWFTSFKETSPYPLHVGGGKVLYGRGIGTIMVEVFNGKSWSRSNLLDVRYVPEFGNVNLFSLGSVVQRRMSVTMDKNGTSIKRGKKTLVVGRLAGTLTLMDIRTVVPETAMVTRSLSAQPKATQNLVHGLDRDMECAEVAADKGRSDAISKSSNVMDINSDFVQGNLKGLWPWLKSSNCMVNLDDCLEGLLLKATFLKAWMQVEKMLLLVGQTTRQTDGPDLDVEECQSDQVVPVVGDDLESMTSNEFASDNQAVIEDRGATSGSENDSFTALTQKQKPDCGKCKKLNKRRKTTSPLRTVMCGNQATIDCAFIAANSSTAEEVVTIAKQWYGTKYNGLQWLEGKQIGSLSSKNDAGGLRRRKCRRSRKRKRVLCQLLSLDGALRGQVN